MNFRTMADMRKENDKNKKKNPKNTESYIGGEKSGLAVENKADDDISSLVAKARQNSQGKVSPINTILYTTKDNKNINKKVKKEELGPNALVITLWQEGFTLSTNPDELRPYNEPKNAKFMAELKQGVVPTEIRNTENAKGLSVSLEDKRGESFHRNQKKKPPTYFGGEGVSLSGNTPAPQVTLKDKNKISKISNII